MAKIASQQLRSGLEPTPGCRLIQLLGRGGYAEVWEAEKPDKSHVALKFLPCNDSFATSREIRSLQAIGHVRHPNLIKIESVWCYLGYIVIDMELGEGSLLDLYEAYQSEFGTPIIAEQVCLYLSQAAEALDFLNTRQHLIDGKRVAIQHCDVKPSNFLLIGETVKLADFGLSSVLSNHSQAHRRAGTLDYTAPEIFQGKLSDRTDQYALAITYCHLRGGRLPFDDTPETFRRDYVRPHPDLSMLPPGEHPIIARGLSSAPQDRWPTCLAMISALSKQLT